jgi:hypothetical protein
VRQLVWHPTLVRDSCGCVEAKEWPQIGGCAGGGGVVVVTPVSCVGPW